MEEMREPEAEALNEGAGEAEAGPGGQPRPPLPPSRFYAVYVTAGMEPRVAALIAERARSLGLDVRSVSVPPRIKGFVIIEAGDIGDLYEAIRKIKYVKRMRPITMKLDDVVKVVKPEEELPTLNKGQVVEIISGPMKGMRGRVIEVHEGKKQVTVSLLDVAFRGTVTLNLDEVRPLEEERV